MACPFNVSASIGHHLTQTKRSPIMKSDYLEGIDYIRAVMSVFVVFWHMGGGGKSLIFSPENYSRHTFTASDFVNFNVLLLAVPSFIFVSTFLYALGGPNNANLKKRIRRTLILLTFWPLAFLKYTNSYHGLLNLYPSYWGSIAAIVLSAGKTVYWYFVSLIVCLLLTHLIARLQFRLQMIGFILSVIVLASLPVLTKRFDFFPLSVYWSPLNFVPFCFAAVLVAQNLGYIQLKRSFLIGASIVLYCLFSIIEWNYAVGGIFFHGQNFAIPAYTRTSLLFGVLALAIFPLTEPGIKSGPVIKNMARYALALYCIHPFLTYQVETNLAKIIQNEIILTYTSIVLVILLSYAIATVLKRYYLREEVLI